MADSPLRGPTSMRLFAALGIAAVVIATGCGGAAPAPTATAVAESLAASPSPTPVVRAAAPTATLSPAPAPTPPVPARPAPTPTPIPLPATATPGPSVVTTIPVLGENVAGLITLHLELVYDPDVLTPTEVILAPGLSDALLEYAVDSPGRLVVGLIEPRGYTGDGALMQIVFEVGQTDEASPLELERLEAFGGESFIDIPTTPREGVYRAAENEFDAPVIVFGR